MKQVFVGKLHDSEFTQGGGHECYGILLEYNDQRNKILVESTKVKNKKP